LTSFLDLGLAEPIARALVEQQYAIPTPIQAQTIPQVLAARDVIGIAQTGTGKTAAFALPILNYLSTTRRAAVPRGCRALALSPTRELSAQIVESFETYGRYVEPRVALAIGGVPIKPQVRALARGVDVLVATPGRLRDLLQMGAARLDQVEIFVLDEADRMLDMAATMPPAITELAGQLLRNPVQVAVTPTATTVERVEQRVIHVDRVGKPALLAQILRQEPIERVLVFTRTKRGADRVVRALAKAGLAAQAIHGNKSQNQRERVLAAFRAGQVRTLIATDIAARGIDVEGISHVVNYDLPNVPESYVHRIGRTARAGADGIAISFCDAEEQAFLRDIEKLIRVSIPSSNRRVDRSAEQRVHAAATARPVHHGNRDRRHSGRSDDRKPATRSDPSRPQRPVAGPTGGIAAVAFLQPKRDPRRRPGGNTTRSRISGFEHAQRTIR
jgi:ATP-dependent RNA helicase RhlE